MKEIKDHVALAKSEPTRQNIEAMWRKVFGLPAWYLIPAQSGEGPSTPVVAELDDGRFLLVFTNFRNLNAFSVSSGRRSPGEDLDMLVLDPAEVVERLADLDGVIDGVAFDISGDHSFRAPLEALREFARVFGVG